MYLYKYLQISTSLLLDIGVVVTALTFDTEY